MAYSFFQFFFIYTKTLKRNHLYTKLKVEN